jgi:hypothetical protein
MHEQNERQPSEALNKWIKQRMDEAVHELLDRGVAESLLVEAKPAWVFPFTLLIGQLREQGRTAGFDWFICGDAPLSCAPSSVAVTARDAARHFALQWQLDAVRQGEAGNELAQRAGALYELVENDSLWQESY